MLLKIRRIIATYIDFLLIFCILMKLGSIFKNYNLYVLIPIIVIITLILYYTFSNKDIVFKNASIGKKIMFLHIVDKYGQKLNNNKLLYKRNIKSYRLFPIYPIMILINNKSYGDLQYETKVVSTLKKD